MADAQEKRITHYQKQGDIIKKIFQTVMSFKMDDMKNIRSSHATISLKSSDQQLDSFLTKQIEDLETLDSLLQHFNLNHH